MKILLSGSAGFIGKALFSHWHAKGYQVIRLVRNPKCPGAVIWDPDRGLYAREDFEGFDAVVHLAGEPITSGLWSDAKKKKIFHSRVHGTRILAKILAESSYPPQLFISISAIGYYGDAGEVLVDENTLPGVGFLSEVCQAWERAADEAKIRNCRLVHPRFGIVLGPGSGVIQKLKLLYQWGLGGVGSGKQWISWIALEDLLRAFDHIFRDTALEGPIQFTSPYPIRQEEFAKQFAKVLHRPCFLNVPAWLLRFVLGQMGEETLLASVRSYPKKLLDSGFSFSFPQLKEALQNAITSTNSTS